MYPFNSPLGGMLVDLSWHANKLTLTFTLTFTVYSLPLKLIKVRFRQLTGVSKAYKEQFSQKTEAGKLFHWITVLKKKDRYSEDRLVWSGMNMMKLRLMDWNRIIMIKREWASSLSLVMIDWLKIKYCRKLPNYTITFPTLSTNIKSRRIWPV